MALLNLLLHVDFLIKPKYGNRVLHQTFAEADFQISCSGQKSLKTLTCNVTTAGPITAEARWIPPSPPSTPLIPRPTEPQTLLNDAPTGQDCNNVSFTHPDWVIENLELVRLAGGKVDNAATSFSLALTSRATGVNAICMWNSSTSSATAIGEGGSFLLASCSPTSSNPDGSKSQFLVRFNFIEESLTVQQEWVCSEISKSHL